jgi:ubiquinone/menaquinone biosynthesis C-methylase UbiE
MPTQDNKYPNLIEKSYSANYLIRKIAPHEKVIDIGSNQGYLVSKFKNAVGVDCCKTAVLEAEKLGRNVIFAEANELPFKDKEFDVAVLSDTLEQMENWEVTLIEAMRVARRVIGVNPIPGVKWGILGYTEWVKSVIPIEKMEKWGARTRRIRNNKYYFEIA